MSKPGTRMLLRQIARQGLHAFERKVIYPWAAWRGWRPSSFRTVQLDDLDYALGYDDEIAIKAATRVVAPFTLLSFDRLASLWLQVRWLDAHRISGSMVECGVRAGGASAMMALAHMASSKTAQRPLDLFDCFDGALPATDEDGATVKQLVEMWNTQPHCSPDTSKHLILNQIGYPQALLRQHIGYFQDTLPQEADALGPIALLRLDGDLYESTKVCLEYLYDHVAANGIIVIDDYGAFAGCRKAVDKFVARLTSPIMLHRIDCVGRYWIKR
ncbi:MAG: TylF/MycF/NovP-related O-methyltransferase [Candidatus Binataceae bacterium]